VCDCVLWAGKQTAVRGQQQVAVKGELGKPAKKHSAGFVCVLVGRETGCSGAVGSQGWVDEGFWIRLTLVSGACRADVRWAVECHQQQELKLTSVWLLLLLLCRCS
jgi:hypothetical protein